MKNPDSGLNNAPVGNVEQVKGPFTPEELVERKMQVVDRLRPYFDGCEYKKYDEISLAVAVILPAMSDEERLVCLELLNLLNIFPWEEDEGRISIEGAHDLATLMSCGLVNEGEFIDLSAGDSQGMSSRYNPYAYPLARLPAVERTSSVGGKKVLTKIDPTESFGEMGVDDELRHMVDVFDKGGDEQDDYRPSEGDLKGRAFSKMIGRRFVRRGEVFWDEKERREITKQEQEKLQDEAKNGDKKSLDKLVRMNAGLVYFVLDNFLRFYPTDSPDDLVQAGLIGLSKAIVRQDRNKGSLSTYAYFYIEGYIRGEWKKDGHIHIPTDIYEARNRYHLIDDKSIDPEEKKDLLTKLARSLRFGSIQEMEDVYVIGGGKFVGVDDESVSHARVSEFSVSNIKTPEEELQEKQLKNTVKETLEAALLPRERAVVELRFAEGMTFEQVGIIFDVNRERIRQIEKKALNKLRRRGVDDILRPYMKSYMSKDY